MAKKKKLRGRPPNKKETKPRAKKLAKPIEEVAPKKKRGRPPKLAPMVAQESIPPVVKKKRGRPFKVNLPEPPLGNQKLKTPRPHGANECISPKSKVGAQDHHIDASLTIGKKDPLHICEDFAQWQGAFANCVAKDTDQLIRFVNRLQDIINKRLESSNSGLVVKIPVVALYRDLVPTRVFFDPYNQVDIVIYYNQKDIQTGATASMKAAQVCNKFNSAVRGVLPVGAF